MVAGQTLCCLKERHKIPLWLGQNTAYTLPYIYKETGLGGFALTETSMFRVKPYQSSLDFVVIVLDQPCALFMVLEMTRTLSLPNNVNGVVQDWIFSRYCPILNFQYGHIWGFPLLKPKWLASVPPVAALTQHYAHCTIQVCTDVVRQTQISPKRYNTSKILSESTVAEEFDVRHEQIV